MAFGAAGLHRVSPCRGLAPRSPPGSASTTGVSLARLAAVGRPRRPTPSGCRRPVLAAAATHRSHASAESPNSSRRLRSGPAGHLVAPSARCSNAEPPPLPWSAPSRRVAGCLASQPRSLASPPRPASSRAASLSRPHALRLLGRGRAGPASPSPPRPLAEQHHLASPSPLRTQPPRRTSAPLRARACAQTRPASLRQITSKLALPRPRFTLAASRRPYGRAEPPLRPCGSVALASPVHTALSRLVGDALSRRQLQLHLTPPQAAVSAGGSRCHPRGRAEPPVPKRRGAHHQRLSRRQ